MCSVNFCVNSFSAKFNSKLKFPEVDKNLVGPSLTLYLLSDLLTKALEILLLTDKTLYYCGLLVVWTG